MLKTELAHYTNVAKCHVLLITGTFDRQYPQLHSERRGTARLADVPPNVARQQRQGSKERLVPGPDPRYRSADGREVSR